jgi:hypothetical protein
MNKRPRLLALMMAALIGAAACSSPTDPTDEGTTVNGQTLNLAIDATPFEPTSITVTNLPASGSVPESVSIIASAPSRNGGPAQSLLIVVPSRVGPYEFRTTGNMVVRLQHGAIGLDQVWEAAGPLGSGTIEITSRTSSTVEGRITATLAAAGTGAGSTGKTCAGTFSVRF